MLKRVHPYQPPTASARLILMEIAENKELEQEVLNAVKSRLIALSGVKIPRGGQDIAQDSRESSTQVVVEESDTTTEQSGDGNLQRIAALFTDLDWREAVLPQRLTPLMYAAQLVEMFPEKNLVTEIQRAQIWHLDRKPSWKRLAHSLNGWLAKPTPEWEKQQHGTPLQATLVMEPEDEVPPPLEDEDE